MAYGIHPGGGCIYPGGGCIPSSLAFSFDEEGKNDHSRCPTSLHNQLEVKSKKRCLRCGTLYNSRNTSTPRAPSTATPLGEKGLFLLVTSPGDRWGVERQSGAGVVVYRWNDKGNRPNTGRVNWKRRWSCCAEYGEDAPPCRCGWHVSYDDDFSLY